MLNMKKILAVALLVVITATAMPLTTVSAAITGVYLSISAPSSWTVDEGGSISFNLNYTGDVGYIGLSTKSVVLNGFTGNVSISGTGNSRVLTISNVKTVGSGKTVSVTGGTAISPSGEFANSITSSAFEIKAKDSVAPVLTLTNLSSTSVKEGETISVQAVYTDNVGIAHIGLSEKSVVLNGFTGNVAVTGTGNTRTITVSNVKNVGTGKSISVTGGTAIDAVGNFANSATSAMFNIEQVAPKDTVAPVLKITGPSLGRIKNGASLTYTANYTDDVAVSYIGLSEKSIVLNGFTADVTVSGTGLATRTITLKNIKGELGKGKSISITGGTAIDAAGNFANSATSATFEIYEDPKDTVAPVLKITGPSLGKIKNGASLTYTANYTDDVAVTYIGLSAKSVVLHGFKADVTISGTGLASRTITLKNIKGEIGTGKYISITGGTAIDAAGNFANSADSDKFEIYEEKVVEPTPDPEPTPEPTPDPEPTPTPTPDPEPEKPSDWIPNPNTGR